MTRQFRWTDRLWLIFGAADRSRWHSISTEMEVLTCGQIRTKATNRIQGSARAKVTVPEPAPVGVHRQLRGISKGRSGILPGNSRSSFRFAHNSEPTVSRQSGRARGNNLVPSPVRPSTTTLAVRGQSREMQELVRCLNNQNRCGLQMQLPYGPDRRFWP